MTSRLPEPPSDEPAEPWLEDDATAEGDFAPDPGIPDDPPDAPLALDEPPEPELDLDAPDDLEDGTWEPDPISEEAPLPLDPTEPVTLGWRETARLPEHGVEVPAILDPTVPTSTWIVPAHPPIANLPLVVEIGAFRVRIDVVVREGRTAELRLGRDALAGRVLIRP
jgi:hypothetical protein